MEQQLEQKVKQEPTKKQKGIWFKFFNSKKLKDPDKVAILFLKNNGIAVPMEIAPKKGVFNINNRSYHERRDCVYTIIAKDKTRFPLAVIPEWASTPLGTQKWYDQDLQTIFGELQDHTLKGIRNAELVRAGDKERGDMNAKKMIGWGILAIMGVAILMNYI